MIRSAATRREFLGQCAAVSAAVACAPWTAAGAAEALPASDWRTMREDPVRRRFRGVRRSSVREVVL